MSTFTASGRITSQLSALALVVFLAGCAHGAGQEARTQGDALGASVERVAVSDSRPPPPDIPAHIKGRQHRGEPWPSPETNQRVAYYEYFGKGAGARTFALPTGLESVTPQLLALEDARAADSSPGSGLEGTGYLSHTLPPEMAYWYAVMDLFERMPSGDIRGGPEHPATLDSGLKALDRSIEQSFSRNGKAGRSVSARQNASVYETRFRLDAGTECVFTHKLFTERDTRALSLADRMNGFDPDSSADQNLGAIYDMMGLSQELYLALHGRLIDGQPRYDLRLFHAYELQHQAVAELHELSLHCESNHPLIARTIQSLRHQLTHDAERGVWTVRVQLQPVTR